MLWVKAVRLMFYMTSIPVVKGGITATVIVTADRAERDVMGVDWKRGD